MKIPFPQYQNSLLALSASVLRHYGVPSIHPSLPLIDRLLSQEYRNVAVLLLDGMGTAILRQHLSEQDFFRRNLRAEISSVYPPTTAAATTTIETGMSPMEHGWLGWSLYFPEIGANVDLFPNVLSGSDHVQAADYHIAQRYFPYTSIYEKIRAASGGQTAAYQVSPFGEWKVDSFEALLKTVSNLCGQPGKKYIYGYWPEPDSTMHDYGVSYPEVGRMIRQFSDAIESFSQSLSDTLLIVTADHGMVDVQYRYFGEMPKLQDCFKQTPYLEARSMMFHVKDDRKEVFAQEFQKAFGSSFRLFSRDEIYQLRLFGEGAPHPRFDSLIGDYLGIAVGSEALDIGLPDHKVLAANHAGLTPEEMQIPLIIAQCR